MNSFSFIKIFKNEFIISACFIALPNIFSLSKASNTPKAAAHETGEAPKVLPIPASWIVSIISALPNTAASGNPPAIPFANVTKSGLTPTVSAPNILPVRP